MAEGVDYSYDPPTPAELVAAGKEFVVRYVSAPGHQKNLTAAERIALQAKGIDIAIVCQVTADDALAGLDRGKVRAASARKQVVDLGGPSTSPIYFVADFDVQPSQVAKCLDYIRGAASVLGHDRTGAYGGRRFIEAVKAANVCRYLWQTRSWSRNPDTGQIVWVPGVHLQQYAVSTVANPIRLGSGEVDLDRSMAADFGQWRVTSMANAQDRGWGPPCPDGDIVTITAGGRNFRVHRGVEAIFVAFITELVSRGYSIDKGTLDDWSYNCRKIAGSDTWSNHAWGLAVDINSLTNPMTAPLTTDMPAWVRDANYLMTKYGLRWGGTYQIRPDPMHFEFMLAPADADRLSAQLQMEEVFMALTDAEQARVLKAADQILGAVGTGQASFSTTVEAILRTTQTLINEGRSQSGVLGQRIDSTKDAVLGALATMDTGGMSEAEREQLAQRIAELDDDLEAAAVVDALAIRLQPVA